MDMIDIIEKYIELVTKRDELKNVMENSKIYHRYAQMDGDVAFAMGDYEEEKRYNDQVKRQQKVFESAREELGRVEETLNGLHQAYMDTIMLFSEEQLLKLAEAMAAKKILVEEQIVELTNRKNEAEAKANYLFSNKDYAKESEYNSISRDCHIKNLKLKSKSHYYGAFINNLYFRANEKRSAK